MEAILIHPAQAVRSSRTNTGGLHAAHRGPAKVHVLHTDTGFLSRGDGGPSWHRLPHESGTCHISQWYHWLFPARSTLLSTFSGHNTISLSARTAIPRSDQLATLQYHVAAPREGGSRTCAPSWGGGKHRSRGPALLPLSHQRFLKRAKLGAKRNNRLGT